MRTIIFLAAIMAAAAMPGYGREHRPGSSPPAEHDLAVISIDTPATAQVPPSVPFTPVITIRNAGIWPEAGYMLFYSIADSSDSIVHRDSLAVAANDSIFPDSVRQFAFSGSFTPLASMSYLATASVALAGDGYPDDDTLLASFSTWQFHDLAIVSIDTPAAFVVVPGIALTPAARIRNSGTYSEGGFRIYYRISDSLLAPVYFDSVTVSDLAALADTQLGFLPFIPESLMAYRAAAFTALVNDSFPGNDTLTLDFRTFEYAGEIGGRVYDENAGNSPLPGAVITAVSTAGSFFDTTDLSGNYLFPSLPNGGYDLSAGKPGYADSAVQGIAVTSGAQISLDFSLGYPSLALTPPDTVSVLLSPGSADSSRWLAVQNTGTRNALCELTWPVRASKALGDSAWGLDIEAITADNLCLGVEFDGTSLWVTGAAGSPSSDPNCLYKLDRNGILLATYPQPAGSGWGWRDLCWDGQFLYAASDSVIRQIDTADGDTTGVRIPGPCAVARGLAYDPASDHFFAADFADSIYEINRSGAVINAWANGMNVFGLAWDAAAPDGPWLWVSSTDTSGGIPRIYLRQFDPRSGVYTGIQIVPNRIDQANAAAGGLAFSAGFIHGRGTLIALLQDANDRLAAYDIRPENAHWLSLSRTSLALAPAQSDSVRLTFDNAGLDSSHDYFAYVRASSGMPGRADSILAILRSPFGVAGDQSRVAGSRFALLPCRPNPAGGRTSIVFSLAAPGPAELAIYNVAGQKIRTLVRGNSAAGWRTVVWDGCDDLGRRIAGGIYFSSLRFQGRRLLNKITLLR